MRCFFAALAVGLSLSFSLELAMAQAGAEDHGRSGDRAIYDNDHLFKRP